MPKKAFLVGFAPQTRVVVDVPEDYVPGDDGEITDRIIQTARNKMLSDAVNYLCGDNCDRLEEDTECPAETFDEDNEVHPAVFTVNDSGKKVQFAPGNLFWNGEKFKFEKHQYDYPKKWNPKHIGHFFWSKSKDIATTSSYMDDAASVSDTLFAADGGAVEGWTTLSAAEGLYLLGNHLGRRVAMIANRYCTILVPDGVKASITKRYYTAEQWADAEARYGLVALPFAGYRYGTKISCVSINGYYWLNSSSPEVENCYALFLPINTDTNTSNRWFGDSIRLVKVL